jgi:hypothetical protein
MSKNIELKSGIPPSIALIKRKDIRQQRASEALLTQAKTRTRHQVKDAEEQATAIRLQAYREGYAEGLHGSLDALLQGLKRIDRLYEQVEQQLQARVFESLGSLFSEDEVLLSIVDGLVRLEPSPSIRQLRIYWPSFASKARHAVVQRLAVLGLEAQVVDAPDLQRLVVEWGDYVWEFDAGAAQSLTTMAVMRAVKQSTGFEQAMASVRQQALEQWRDELSAVIAPGAIK